MGYDDYERFNFQNKKMYLDHFSTRFKVKMDNLNDFVEIGGKIIYKK